ncbi:hypothetical protein ABFP60_18485 [Clostridioides difficile]
MNILISEEIKIYKCCDIDNPFKTREGETIVDLDRYVEVLKENNIPFTQEQYQEAKKNLINLNKKE